MSDENTPLVAVNELAVHTKGGLSLVKPISLRLYAGQNVTILGETGSGKSLLAQAIMGALPDELVAEGKVVFSALQDGDSTETLWGKQMAMLPQEPSRSLDPTMTVLNQVWETGCFVGGLSSQQAREQATQTLQALGLAKFVRYYPHQLSGGMAQRASFATATAGGATIVIADEPTKGLDESNKQVVIGLLQQIAKNGGALLTITHDIDVARALACNQDDKSGDINDEMMVMKKGDLLEHGQAKAVLDNPTSDYARELIASAPHNWQAVDKPDLSNKLAEEILVEAIDLTLARGERTLFSGVNFRLKKGEVLGLVGDSGIGKSSLGDALCGLLEPVGGALSWSSKQSKKGKGQVLKLYQDPPSAFAPHLPLRTLLNDVINKHDLDGSRVPTLLQQLKLTDALLDRNALNVSGGELQRVSILRALLFDPVLLVADEVTSRLDPITQKETLDLLVEQCRAIGCALVIICHDTHIIEHYCHQVLDLSKFQSPPR